MLVFYVIREKMAKDVGLVASVIEAAATTTLHFILFVLGQLRGQKREEECEKEWVLKAAFKLLQSLRLCFFLIWLWQTEIYK